MPSLSKSFAALLVLALASSAKSVQIGTCKLQPTDNAFDPDNSRGDVTFTWDEDNDQVRVQGSISGVEPDNGEGHGFHVHAFGDLSATDGSSLGGHYTADDQFHALPSENATFRHYGDMGNAFANADGEISFDEVFDLLSLSGDPSIIGRGVVLHRGFDKGQAEQPSGAAGERGLVCTIGRGMPGNSDDTNDAAQGSNSVSGKIVLRTSSGAGEGFLVASAEGSETRVRGTMKGFPTGTHTVELYDNGDLVNGLKDSGVDPVLTEQVTVEDSDDVTCVEFTVPRSLTQLIGGGVRVADDGDQTVTEAVVGVANPDNDVDVSMCDFDDGSSDASRRSVMTAAAVLAVPLLSVVLWLA